MGRKFKLTHKKHFSVKKEAAHDEEVAMKLEVQLITAHRLILMQSHLSQLQLKQKLSQPQILVYRLLKINLQCICYHPNLQ